MRRVTYDPRNPPGRELKRVPHVKFDRYFDMDGKSEATIPKPRGVRGYQMFVQHSRLMCLIRVLSGMINNLVSFFLLYTFNVLLRPTRRSQAGQRTRQVPTREAKAMPQAFLDLQYQSMKITMTKKLGSEKEALEAMKLMGINNAADCVKALDQFAGVERVHRCENCLRKGASSSDIPLDIGADLWPLLQLRRTVRLLSVRNVARRALSIGESVLLLCASQ